MEVLHPRCAGLDVHKDEIKACARIVKGSRAEKTVASFGTTTDALLELSDWLQSRDVTHVAMEATGVYWKPVWAVLEGNFELVLANAAAIKNVPGRKTDVNDATWIADLLAHGLIRSSYVPPAHVQDLRDLTRTRTQLVRERASHVNRIQKVLEGANIKMGSVLSDVVGVSGRAILNAIVQGETRPEVLAGLANYRVRASKEKLIASLRGKVRDNHRFLLKLHLSHIDALDSAITAIEKEVTTLLEPFRPEVELLKSIPGVSDTAANVILAELGTDMSKFPSAQHARSWARLCPRNDESAGKKRSTRVLKGGNWLKTTLIQSSWAAIKVPNSYLRSLFLRIKARRGPLKAIMAVAASIFTSAYHMLRTGELYRELGGDYFAEMDRERQARRLLSKLRRLGYEVEAHPAASAVST